MPGDSFQTEKAALTGAAFYSRDRSLGRSLN